MAGENSLSKPNQSLVTDNQSPADNRSANLADIGTAFILKTVHDYDTHGARLLELWKREHEELDDIISELKDIAGLNGVENSMGQVDRGMPVMEALSQTLKTRTEHSGVLQKHLESRTKFIAALKAASSVVINVDNNGVDKSGIDVELQDILNNSDAHNYDED